MSMCPWARLYMAAEASAQSDAGVFLAKALLHLGAFRFIEVGKLFNPQTI